MGDLETQCRKRELRLEKRRGLDKGRQKKQMLFMFHFISVITDIQLNDFKTTSKVPYKGNYKWV